MQKTKLNNSGKITYDKASNHLKIHCYGDATTKINYTNSFGGHLELIVDGKLSITQSCLFIFNSYIPFLNTACGDKGSIIDIKCYDLLLQDTEISANGASKGGTVNINVKNDCIFLKGGPKKEISANALYKSHVIKKAGGCVNINIGNEWVMWDQLRIDVREKWRVAFGESRIHIHFGKIKFGAQSRLELFGDDVRINHKKYAANSVFMDMNDFDKNCVDNLRR